MKSLLLIIAMIGFTSCQRTADSSKLTESESLDSIIREFEEDLQTDVDKDSIGGSISAAIVSGDKIIWSKAFGYADKANKLLADTATIYRAGSISKSFTAFLMMKLVNEGVIRLDDPIEKYLPEVRRLKGYSDSTKITFRQLASHTSGLRREPQLANANAGPIDGWEDKLLSSIPTTIFESRPGTKYSYSNIGFGILGLALSRAAHQPFMQLIREKIFMPLKMNRSFYIVPSEYRKELAVGMNGGPHEGIDIESPMEEHNGRGYKVPNGGIYSTPNDLAKFMINNLGSSPILKQESIDAMQTDAEPASNKYGLGFMIFHNDQVNIVGHDGQVLGYTAQFAFEKESKFGVILMRNYTSGATDLDKASFMLLNRLKQLKQ